MDLEADLQAWVGREEVVEDEVSARLIDGFNATLDRLEAPAVMGQAAPLGIHWCLFPAIAPQSGLGPDGHPARGGFLPPVELPNRMWAGGQMTFHDEIRAGDRLTRLSRIAAVTSKQGRSGALCFVTVDHEIASARGLAIAERQDIVYRQAQSAGKAPTQAGAQTGPQPAWRQERRADAVLLFRYSALTFNGHRIHYDREYATKTEHYPGLVVHGPLQATLLLNFAAACAKAAPRQFSFRGVAVLSDFERFSLNARETGHALDLWIETETPNRTMQARAVF